MASNNRITKVAIVGVRWRQRGQVHDRSPSQTGKHTVTAITRIDSQTPLPEGVSVKKVDYNKPGTVVEALRGQDALVVTLSGHALSLQDNLTKAAGEAGVPWILPNAWGPNVTDEALVRDVPMFKPFVSTGFWYEWSLAIPPAFGLDLKNRSVTLFDEGRTKISISSWPQVGRAVAALLSLPIRSEGSDKSACLENFKNQLVYVNSFTINQKDMLESVLRVTATKESDWSIAKEPAQERYAAGQKEMQAGNRAGFGKVMYTRVLFTDGVGDTEHSRGTINKVLGLEKDDAHFDEYTKVALERSKSPQWHKQ
ncbi:hypothetical protein LTR64_008023 [Lithohypha guttulata]|uniref:uncharacterized protein n=1 Tax=Lithohypha guttulata TaxID=1690604 RepID=UPI002DDF1999|nr:hypothetical protein LTR51_008108 [Lithohypha guttulata]